MLYNSCCPFVPFERMNVLCWRSGLSALCRPFGSNSALRRRCHAPASVPLAKEAEITEERPYLDINEEIRGTEILPFVSANEVDFSQKNSHISSEIQRWRKTRSKITRGCLFGSSNSTAYNHGKTQNKLKFIVLTSEVLEQKPTRSSF